MSTLTLVRHGQATAFAKNSDRLTTLGEQQAHKLGEAWALQNVSFNRILCGTLQRQRHTAEIACSYLPQCPALEYSPAFNEYDATGVTTTLADAVPELQALRNIYLEHRQSEDRNKYFQRFFESAMGFWMAGQVQPDGVETATAFFQRVETGLHKIMADAIGNQRIAIFTSGGVIGRTVQWTTAAPPANALELNWRIRNCSVTEFLFSKGRISLDLFNATSHLPPDMISYR